jgi:hypothetical protein
MLGILVTGVVSTGSGNHQDELADLVRRVTVSRYEIGHAGIETYRLGEQIDGIRMNHAAGVGHSAGHKVDWV